MTTSTKNTNMACSGDVMQVLRIKEVMSRTGLSRGGIYARMALDEFPQSIGLGGRAVGWLKSDINDWIRACILQSRTEVNA